MLLFGKRIGMDLRNFGPQESAAQQNLEQYSPSGVLRLCNLMRHKRLIDSLQNQHWRVLRGFLI
jgi:hypothetical protein